MRLWRSIGLLALAIGLTAMPALAADKKKEKGKEKSPAEHTSSAPARRAWMFGVNGGMAGARFVGTSRSVLYELRSDTPVEFPPLFASRPDWEATSSEAAVAVQYRLSYALNPSLAIGLERSSWSKDVGDNTWSFGMSSLSATMYPRAGHLFFRGGAGLASLKGKGNTTLENQYRAVLRTVDINLPPFFFQYEDAGFGLEAAAGYEWRVYKRVSLAPELSVRYMSFANGVFTEIGGATLGLNWWF